MNRAQFIQTLRNHLSELPTDEVDKSVNYFNEMIDDRIEEGMTEEEAVADIGDVRLVAEKILDEEKPLLQQLKSQVMPKQGMTGGQKVLLILGFPLWGALLLAAVLLGLALLVLYLSLWLVAGLCILAGLLGFISSFFRILDNWQIALLMAGFGLAYLGFGSLLLVFNQFITKKILAAYTRFRKGR